MATTVITRPTGAVAEHAMDRSWIESLVYTHDMVSLTVARIGLGVVMLPHGLQKAFGMFGGSGFSGTMQHFGSQGIPSVVAFLVICSEVIGSLFLIFGFMTRVAAFGVLCVMLGAMFMVHLPNGFFMNWGGAQAGEGFEYHVLAITLAIALMIAGGGRYSVDRAIYKNRVMDDDRRA